MTKTILAAALTLATMGTSLPAAAQTALNATFRGTATTNQQFPEPGQQTFTLTGNFLTYVASSGLPQITTDLDRYFFTVSGLATDYNGATRTTTYGNVQGSIFYDYGGGTTGIVQTFAPTTLTVTFDALFQTATILTSLTSTGPQQPAGFPGPVDLSAANGARVDGLYVSSGSPQSGTVTGSITFPGGAVPEPGTWLLMLGGFGLVGGGLRASRRRVAFA